MFNILKSFPSRRQSSKDLRQGLLRRQSSRDVVAGGPKPVPVAVDPRLELGERVTIRRDSVNGLRILTRDSEAEAEADTLQVGRDWCRPGAELSLVQRLSDIAISATAEFSRFQEAALRTHNVYRARHGVPALTLDTELCRRCSGNISHVFHVKYCNPSQSCRVRGLPRPVRHLRAQRRRGQRREPVLELEQRHQLAAGGRRARHQLVRRVRRPRL